MKFKSLQHVYDEVNIKPGVSYEEFYRHRRNFVTTAVILIIYLISGGCLPDKISTVVTSVTIQFPVVLLIAIVVIVFYFYWRFYLTSLSLDHFYLINNDQLFSRIQNKNWFQEFCKRALVNEEEFRRISIKNILKFGVRDLHWYREKDGNVAYKLELRNILANGREYTKALVTLNKEKIKEYKKQTKMENIKLIFANPLFAEVILPHILLGVFIFSFWIRMAWMKPC